MITAEQLILAWRKAKVDLYYSGNLPLLVKSTNQPQKTLPRDLKSDLT